MDFFEKTELFFQSVTGGAATRRDGTPAVYWGFLSRIAKADLPMPEAMDQLLSHLREEAGSRIERFAKDHPELEIGSIVEGHEIMDLETDDFVVMWRVPIIQKRQKVH